MTEKEKHKGKEAELPNTILPAEEIAAQPASFWLELSSMMFNSSLVRRWCRTFLLAGESRDSLPVGRSKAIAPAGGLSAERD